jgi:hypothetical protein
MNLIPLPHVANLNFQKSVPFKQKLELSTPNYPSEILLTNIQELFPKFNFSKEEKFLEEGYEIEIGETEIKIKSSTEISIFIKKNNSTQTYFTLSKPLNN